MRAKLAVLLLCPSLAWAQAPLSAIDWLASPAPLNINPIVTEAPVTETATTPDIAVETLGEVQIDAVGLLPPQTTGLPLDLWRNSQSSVLVDLIKAQRVAHLPAMQSLFYTLLLAEAEAPQEADPQNVMLQARLDALLETGAVEAVQAMLDRAGPNTPALFDRWFSATLLTGDENTACGALVKDPSLSTDYAARVFCTARLNDWTTAELTLETGRLLGVLSKQEASLLQHFLDPEVFEGEPLPHPPVRPTPLVFRLQEAVGVPMPTAPLPRAFAVADLRGTTGWKAKIEAAERLAQTGAIAENRLLGIYTERAPAASGGIWDRVDAVQDLDRALKAQDGPAVERTLPKAFAAVSAARLEVPFAKLFADALMALPLRGDAQTLAYRVALLSPNYDQFAQLYGPQFPEQAFLTALAQGHPQDHPAATELERAIQAGFSDATLPEVFQVDAQDRKLGEIILRTMLRYQRAVAGETHELTTALSALRALGLEDAARQAALQKLLLKRGF